MLPHEPQNAPPAQAHSMLEDIYALFVGCVLVTLGLILLKAAHLVTGGSAGVALLISYFVPLPVGLLFLLINLPFFLFAGEALGRRFMGRTILVNGAIMLLSALAPQGIQLRFVNPVVASLGGGTAIGMGILALARHSAGVGGSGVIALWLLRKNGWNAGRTQIAIDIVVLCASLIAIPPALLLWSALSALVMNSVVMLWHRTGRYTGH